MIKTIRFMGTAALLSSVAFAADEGVKVGGFVDAQYNWLNQPNYKNTNTFNVNDGALYLGKSLGAGEVFVDIPFRSKTEAEISGGSTNNSNFVVGADKAQAYVAWKYENGLSWKLGQFDSLYGFESNDSPDLVFAKQGLLYGNVPNTPNALDLAGLTAVKPMVHTGLAVTYDLSELLGVTFLVANPNPQAKMYDGNPDFGFKISSKFDIFHTSVGGLFTRVGDNKGSLFDIMAGAKFGKLMADLEVTFDKKPMGSAETRFGSLVQLGYSLNDKMNVATRFEYTKLGTLKALSWTTGPQWSFSRDLVAKLDYTLCTVDGTDKTTSSSINLAAVQKF